MKRFELLFERLQKKQEGAFVPFVTLCDPDFERSFEIICTMVDSGADALELGLPFSDPLLDGEVIQAANKRALQAGYSTAACFDLLAKVRVRYPDIPIGLLLCANLIYAPTPKSFYQRCQAVGVDAVLIADVPVDYIAEFSQVAEQYHIASVLICPPNASQATLQKIATQTQAYTYLVSRSGVTGADNQQQAKSLDDIVPTLKQLGAAPILQGFGIATPHQVHQALSLGVDGVISGSAVVRIIERHLDNQARLLSELRAFVSAMKKATQPDHGQKTMN